MATSVKMKTFWGSNFEIKIMIMILWNVNGIWLKCPEQGAFHQIYSLCCNIHCMSMWMLHTGTKWKQYRIEYKVSCRADKLFSSGWVGGQLIVIVRVFCLFVCSFLRNTVNCILLVVKRDLLYLNSAIAFLMFWFQYVFLCRIFC